jgi:hypothetical protein
MLPGIVFEGISQQPFNFFNHLFITHACTITHLDAHKDLVTKFSVYLLSELV